MDSHAAAAGAFATTRWSVVLAAGGSDTAGAAALETLCRACWPPIYAFIRRLGHPPEDARDLTQGFFSQVLRRNSIAAARPEGGRFRSYLLGALKHYLADVREAAQTAKRGGAVSIVPLETEDGEESYGWEPADSLTPERLFERRWALALLARALARLQEECQLTGKAYLFSTLRGFLSEGATTITYPEAAEVLNMTEANARMTVARLRRRYGELIRSEVADTLDDHADLDDELRYLLSVLGPD